MIGFVEFNYSISFSGCCGHFGTGYRTGRSVLIGGEYRPDQACLKSGHNSVTMKKLRQILIGAAIVISIFIVAAVCRHSVEEIHYLKKFYPKQFSVEEVFYASAVELVKVIIIPIDLADSLHVICQVNDLDTEILGGYDLPSIGSQQC